MFLKVQTIEGGFEYVNFSLVTQIEPSDNGLFQVIRFDNGTLLNVSEIFHLSAMLVVCE